jgi:hypothetical protein
MRDSTGHQAEPKRGEAAWKAAKERIEERNQQARKVGRQQRQAAERQMAERRRAAEVREAAQLRVAAELRGTWNTPRSP